MRNKLKELHKLALNEPRDKYINIAYHRAALTIGPRIIMEEIYAHDKLLAELEEVKRENRVMESALLILADTRNYGDCARLLREMRAIINKAVADTNDIKNKQDIASEHL